MKIAILGCGNMGYAYAKSLHNQHLVDKSELFLYETYQPRADFLNQEGIGTVQTNYNEQLGNVDIIVLAVKPQSFGELAQEIKPFLQSHQLVISIMAGVKQHLIENKLGLTKVVRAMPNTPCQIGFGITGYFVPPTLSEEETAQVTTVLKSTGNALAVKEEHLIDAVTAVSGSGPAYFFYIIQQMTASGKKLGLSEQEAYTLASETMHGAYQLMQSSDLELQALIDAVTSKGGTTAAALETFRTKELDKTIEAALSAANKRAGELSNLLAS